MRKDFVAFILTYGRPNNCITVESLRKSGYTGDVVILVDDDDPSLPEYREVYGDQVHVMSKLDAAAITDTGDCAKHYRGTVYARNACFPIAKQLGYRYFVELDDDYGWFGYRYPGKRDGETEPKMHGWKILDIDAVWESLVDLLNDTGAHSVAMSQGGDHMGGTIDGYQMKLMRKAMNSWVCDVKKPFTFVGRMNDDVSTYVSGNRVGRLFFTVKPLQLNRRSSTNLTARSQWRSDSLERTCRTPGRIATGRGRRPFTASRHHCTRQRAREARSKTNDRREACAGSDARSYLARETYRRVGWCDRTPPRFWKEHRLRNRQRGSRASLGC